MVYLRTSCQLQYYCTVVVSSVLLLDAHTLSPSIQGHYITDYRSSNDTIKVRGVKPGQYTLIYSFKDYCYSKL
jgi:hypothetical protein